MEAFERYVDIEGITSDTMDQLAEYFVRANMKDSGELAIMAATGLARVAADQLKPHIVPSVRDSVDKVVTSRAWKAIAPRGNGNAAMARVEAGTFRVIRELLLGVVYYRGIVSRSMMGMDEGHVVAAFTPLGLGTQSQVKLKVRFHDGHWRIAGLPAVGEILERAGSRR